MHEASVAQGLLDLVKKTLRDYEGRHPQNGNLKVTEIICEAGLLACFEPATLEACFEIFAEDTPLEGAKLRVETAPLACKCKNCGENFALTRRKFICPFCESENITFQNGNGLVLKALNVEEQKNG